MPDMEDLGLTEDDDEEVAVDWDEMADWPLDGEEDEDEDE